MTDENEARDEKDARKWVRERFADRVNENKPTLREIAKKHNLLARKVEDLQKPASDSAPGSYETRIAMLEATVRSQSEALEKLLTLVDDLISASTEAPRG